MKRLALCLVLSVIAICAFAQGADTTRIGKIVYYEGKVEVGPEGKMMPAKINTAVRKNSMVRTTGDAVAEITWNNGKKSVVGPNSKVNANALMASSGSAAKSNTEGVFTGFNKVFQENNSKKRSEEGGIRRSETVTRDKASDSEMYWKSDREISFEEAYSIYENKEYAKAISAFHAFLNQKPNDENARYAHFALGHCYIMSDNNLKAKEIFESFLIQYPTDPLRADAEKIIAQL
ncbi:MAG: outer membrane protein assembly factor BamD [Flavobacteriales bacterium]|jgi:TolA-binding protein